MPHLQVHAGSPPQLPGLRLPLLLELCRAHLRGGRAGRQQMGGRLHQGLEVDTYNMIYLEMRQQTPLFSDRLVTYCPEARHVLELFTLIIWSAQLNIDWKFTLRFLLIVCPI